MVADKANLLLRAHQTMLKEPRQGARKLKSTALQPRLKLSRHCRLEPLTSLPGLPKSLANARMAELVDALVSGTSLARGGGSSPLPGTSFKKARCGDRPSGLLLLAV
jgi:hypothetical protein